MSERFWTVVGHEGGRVVFERDIAVDEIAESAVKELLQRLAARNMTEDDVVEASLDDSGEGPLAVSRLAGEGFGFTTGTVAGRYYVALLGEPLDDDGADDGDAGRSAFYVGELD